MVHVRIPCLQAFTPHYAEDVTYSMAALREEKEGANGSLLNLLTSLFSEEWRNFCERVGVLHTSSKLPPRLNDELQKWASDRAQVLSRTVRGVMRYGDGLRVLARLEGLPEEQLEMTVASKFEFIVTSQIYGKLSGRSGLQARLEALGYTLSREDMARVFESFKDLADKKREVNDRDLEILMDEEKRTASEPISYTLGHVQFTGGDQGIPTATVKLVGPEGEEITDACTGNGPVLGR